MRVLISGAGIAGLCAALDLADAGHDVTVVERAPRLRGGGSPVDIRGEAVAVAERMGVLDQVVAHRVDSTERLQFVDSTGNAIAEPPAKTISESPEDVEVPREDLLEVLRAKLPPSVALRFGDRVVALRDDGEGVDVRLASSCGSRYDAVVGADGLHSVVRRIVFGPEPEFLRHLGLYVALAALPSEQGRGGANPVYNFPGRMIGVFSYNDVTAAAFMFRSPWLDYDYHDLDAQKEILLAAYAGHSEWRIPELLAAAQNDPALYFDSVSQIHMGAWHKGRVVLVGDAAHSASNLSGRGASLALTGTWLLAQALRARPDDHLAAFEQYEQAQRAHADLAQAAAGPGADLFVPATHAAIQARNRRLGAPRADGLRGV